MFRLSKNSYVKWVFANFVVLAVAGALLRYMHCFSLPFNVNYQYLLHAHSHFAFAGWMFLGIVLLIFYNFDSKNTPFGKQFNLIFASTLLVGFGMLLSFFLSGYHTLSIVLSTLFIFLGYWFVIVFFKSKILQYNCSSIESILIKGGLIFLVISSIGPFGLGYLKASGFKNMSLQQNAVYFYLHFQLNGFMQLTLIGLFVKNYLKSNTAINHTSIFWTKVLVWSTLPLYSMFTLWTRPSIWIYILTFLSAAAHLLAWFVLIFRLKADLKPLSFLAKIALIAMSLQFVFQSLIAFPAIGNWAFASRNLIIGYIHLLTLGSFSPLIIDLFIKTGRLNPSVKLNFLFVATAVMYLVLLFGSAFLSLFQIYIPNLELYLFATNLLLPIVGIGYFIDAIHH